MMLTLAVAVLRRLQLAIRSKNDARASHIGIFAIEQDRNLF